MVESVKLLRKKLARLEKKADEADERKKLKRKIFETKHRKVFRGLRSFGKGIKRLDKSLGTYAAKSSKKSKNSGFLDFGL